MSVEFERSPIAAYFDDLKTLLLHPVQFYKADRLSSNLATPLAFGLVSHWLGRAIEQLWLMSLNIHSSGWMDRFSDIETLGKNARWHAAQERFSEWMSGVGAVVADPFITLVMILISAFFFYISARIFIGAVRDRKLHEVTLDSAIRIVAYSQAAALLAIIPVAGGALSFLGTIWLMAAGTRELYNVSKSRSLLTVLFPKLFVIIGALIALTFILILAGILFVHFS
jgi:hypothetical protein